mmetsp:Transcript_564/g.1093  ORF Transcript_564/g.1093 Transcript_564/m.1093 type:complete len:149 (+) Transcript_564:686-1132(+)
MPLSPGTQPKLPRATTRHLSNGVVEGGVTGGAEEGAGEGADAIIIPRMELPKPRPMAPRPKPPMRNQTRVKRMMERRMRVKEVDGEGGERVEGNADGVGDVAVAVAVVVAVATLRVVETLQGTSPNKMLRSLLQFNQSLFACEIVICM